MLASSFPTFQLTKAAITNRQISSKPLEWTYSLEVDQYARPTGSLLTVRPRVLGSMSTGLLETREPRRYDIEFEGPRRDTDSFEIKFGDVLVHHKQMRSKSGIRVSNGDRTNR